MRRNSLENMRLSVRTHVAMLVVIAIIFLGAGRLIRLQIQDFYYRQMEAESQRLATSYAYNLEQALESIGMVPSKDNPIYEFIQSSECSRVDPIRKSLRDGKCYKFGYVRLQDGRFAQIGVRAERIQHLMGRFEVQELLKYIRTEHNVAEARFVPQDQVNRAGTSDPQDVEVTQAGSDMHVVLTPNGQKLFRFEAPVELKGEPIGRLVLGHDLTRTDELVDYVSNVWIVALVLIYLMIAVMIYSG
ncbi:MAG: hypothetical protein GX934_16805, partial [Burkholderiales bacterium]|nr:hypothetical protein [Burkholderiales bacterium]